ncbi:hypothetical protein QVD17_29851 [Tagetes erecta]|uniref:Uncharacterized protein n=1 Tax=Tagetes erecta TaxID=13708 RepID=A0AAD8K0E3_TARER|nr:hypothetical protein QVD17_29851 [Tagetes erecta]
MSLKPILKKKKQRKRVGVHFSQYLSHTYTNTPTSVCTCVYIYIYVHVSIYTIKSESILIFFQNPVLFMVI